MISAGIGLETDHMDADMSRLYAVLSQPTKGFCWVDLVM